MLRKLVLGVGMIAVALLGSWQTANAEKPDGPDAEFGSVALRLESNATDNDAEVVIVIDSGGELKTLKVSSPNGKKILNLKSTDGQRLGVSKLTVETPEPTLAEVKAAYPAGVYQFRAETVDGEDVSGQATLSHELLPATTITAPLNGATNVPTTITAAWTAVAGASGYFIEIDDGSRVLKADLPATSTTFIVPPGWLQPDTEYTLGVAAVGENGNRVATEVSFRTAP